MYIEHKLVVGLGKSFLKLASDRAVRGTDVGADSVTDDVMYVKHLGQLACIEIVQKQGSWSHRFWSGSNSAWKGRGVVGEGEKPDPVESTS